MKRADVHSEAEAELLDAMDWYDEKRTGLGNELMSEVQEALRKLVNNPAIGARYRNGPTRFYRLDRFPYVIYYEEFPDRLWIKAIAHGRRRQGYWSRRKPG